jgi:hypothetical protein
MTKRDGLMKRATLVLAALALLLGGSGPARAGFILETSPLGVTNGGTTLSSNQFLGARFTLTQSYHITSLGGHIKGLSGTDRTLFVAINQITSPSIFPNDVNLSDAIFDAVLTAPYNDMGPYPQQVPETDVSTDFVLGPGTYSIMFGSGLFGATGSGWMPVPISSYGTPSYFYRNDNRTGTQSFSDGDFGGGRFVVQGDPVTLPEPASIALFGTAIATITGYVGWRRRKQPERGANGDGRQ